MKNQIDGAHTDPADAVTQFLRAAGADHLGHSRGRSLLDHLVETRRIAARWLQPAWVQDAAALHSVYGTDIYRDQLVTVSSRDQVRAVAGERAERLAYLFGAVERRALFAWFEAPDEHPGTGLIFDTRFSGKGASETLTRREAGHLLVLHMANLAEQACDEEGLPGRWIARVSRWGAKLAAAGLPAPRVLGGCSSVISADDEQGALASYLAGLSTPADQHFAAADHFAAASQLCPWVGEPWVWRAWLALALGRDGDARLLATEARRRFVELGTCWDKRLSFDRWLSLADSLDECGARWGGHLPPLDMQRPSDSFKALRRGDSVCGFNRGYRRALS
jgi:hypothetical protein